MAEQPIDLLPPASHPVGDAFTIAIAVYTPYTYRTRGTITHPAPLGQCSRLLSFPVDNGEGRAPTRKDASAERPRRDLSKGHRFPCRLCHPPLSFEDIALGKSSQGRVCDKMRVFYGIQTYGVLVSALKNEANTGRKERTTAGCDYSYGSRLARATPPAS